MLAPHVGSAPLLGSLLLLTQFIGLGSAWLTRVAEGSRHQQASHQLFFVCLLLAGLATACAVPLGPGYWLACGAVFALMVITATSQFTSANDAW